jgi:hypothetical protein
VSGSLPSGERIERLFNNRGDVLLKLYFREQKNLDVND